MDSPRFQFSNVVLVEGNLIGVIVKTWGASERRETHYEVYVRSLNIIREYDESDIRHYVYDKELSDEQMEYQ